MLLKDFCLSVVYVLKFKIRYFMMHAMRGMFQIPSSKIFFGCCFNESVLNAGTFCLSWMEISIWLLFLLHFCLEPWRYIVCPWENLNLKISILWLQGPMRYFKLLFEKVCFSYICWSLKLTWCLVLRGP